MHDTIRDMKPMALDLDENAKKIESKLGMKVISSDYEG